ncbi:MAG: hypothetical protein AAF492_12695 [Verrucomicrobiota bacterium]
MSHQAKVTSIDALDSFRAKLITYTEKAGRVLEQISSEVTHTRMWLLNDRRLHWKRQVKLCQKKLEAAKEDLFAANMSRKRSVGLAKIAVRRAEEALREAEEKLKLVTTWTRQFDHLVTPLAAKPEKLQHILGHDLPKARIYLDRVMLSLEAYTGRARPRDASTESETETPAQDQGATS